MEVRVAGAVAVDLATKADVSDRFERIARLLERPHSRFFRPAQGKAPRAGNLPFVISVGRPPGGWLWLAQYVIVTGDDPTAGPAAAASTSDVDVDASSANPAAANNVTLPGAAGATTYITGFEITGDGATAGSIIAITVTGILGGTKTYYLTIPIGAAAAVTPLQIQFSRPIPASALNTAITVNVPSFGLGNTNAAATAHGFQRTITPAGALSNVRAAAFAGSAPNDASLGGSAPLTGVDFANAIMSGIVVPSTVEFPSKAVVYSNEDLYVVIGGAGTVAGANFYHVGFGVIELPQTPEALTW